MPSLRAGYTKRINVDSLVRPAMEKPRLPLKLKLRETTEDDRLLSLVEVHEEVSGGLSF